MSDATHLLLNGGDEPSCPSSIGWIILMIVFLLAAIGLAIWIIVLYATGSVGKSGAEARIVTLPGAKITANANSVTGSWGTLGDEKDKVTLYVSENPFVFNADGTVVTSSGVKSDSKSGSKGDVDVSVSTNTAYNAILVASGDDTVHYRVFGPQKVFTQTSKELPNRIFSIRDLNNCTGAISTTGTYSETENTVGYYRLGTGETGDEGASASTTSNSFLINVADRADPTTETPNILCRLPGNNNTVGLGFWSNKAEDTITQTPVVCVEGTQDCSTSSSGYIPNQNCQWSYNLNPNSVEGENRWCLSTEQAITSNQAAKEAVCLNRNGPNLDVVSSINATTWFNSFYSPSLKPIN